MSDSSKLFGASKIDRKDEDFTYTWTVTNLNLLLEANFDSITSPQFSTNDKKWNLSLHRSSVKLGCFYFQLSKIEHSTTDYQYLYIFRNDTNGKCIKSLTLKDGSDVSNRYIDPKQLYDDVPTYSTKKIQNDTLKIICQIKFVSYSYENMSVNDRNYFKHISNISKSKHMYVENLFLEEQFSDIKLVTSCGKELKAHKCIVAADSPTFAAMFKHDMVESNSNTVNISDVDHEVLKEMLRFIYMGQVENIETIASDLFIAADKYDIQDLKNECANYIANNITVENAILIFELAVKYNAEQLKTRVMHFVKSNIVDIMKINTFKEKLQVTAMGCFSELFTFLI